MDELIFKYVSIDVTLLEAQGLFARGSDTVCVLVRNGEGKWVLGRKPEFYPEGISRMIGGGMDRDRNPALAAVRELREETDLRIDEEKLVPLVHVEATAHLPKDKTQNVSIFVFYLQTSQAMTPMDDIKEFSYYSDREFLLLVERYLSLPESPSVHPGKLNWHEYGAIWGPTHRASFERVKELGL